MHRRERFIKTHAATVATTAVPPRLNRCSLTRRADALIRKHRVEQIEMGSVRIRELDAGRRWPDTRPWSAQI
jgi:hypothetical protein